VFDAKGNFLSEVAPLLDLRADMYRRPIIRNGLFYAAAEDADGVPYLVRAKVIE
jgi:hypothetical protein